MTRLFVSGTMLLLMLAPVAAWSAPTDFTPKLTKRADGLPMVTLHAKKCLIVEAEKDPVPLGAKDGATCARLTKATIEVRKRGFKRMRLKAGRYVFRIMNADVPWPIDFALRGAHGNKNLPRTGKAAKGAPQGQGLDYVIDLVPGVYVYASPMNGTPEYPLLVEQ